MHFRTLYLCLLTLALGFTSLHADPLKIELVSAVTSIQPGQPFKVGLHLEHKKDYHTYWKFPGIVGVATNMAWKLPDGWKAGPIEWPEPERVFMFKIMAQGYHDELVLPITITPPKNAVPGTTVKLQGQATWMCCARECNPGFADLSLDLPVQDEAPVANKKWSGLFAKAKASLPGQLTGWKTTAARKGDTVTLKLKPKDDAAVSAVKDALFFTEDGFIHSDAEQPFQREEDGAVTLELKVSEYAPKPQPKVLKGLVQSPQGWVKGGPKTVEIEVEVE